MRLSCLCREDAGVPPCSQPPLPRAACAGLLASRADGAGGTLTAAF